MKNIENLIKDNTKEDVIDWKAVEIAINEDINNIIKKNVETEKAKFESSKVSEMLENLGYKDVDELKKALGSIEELTKTIETKDAENQALKSSSTELERMNKLYGMGINEEAVDFVLFNVNKKVTEEKDFDTALAEYQKEQPKFFEKTITFGGTQQQSQQQQDDGVTSKLKEMYPDVDFD